MLNAAEELVCLYLGHRLLQDKEPIRMDVAMSQTTRNGGKHMKSLDKYVGLNVHKDTTVVEAVAGDRLWP